MTARHDLDRVLTAWLTDEVGPAEAPAYFAETLDLVDRTPQRRAWPWSGLAIPRRWTRIDVRAGAWAVIVVMLLVLALVVAALIGAFPEPPPVPTGPGRIVVTTLDGPLAVVHPDGGSDQLPPTEGSPTMASVSPDGTRVAWWTWMTETDNEGNDTTTVPLTVANLDGSDAVQVLDGIEPRISTVEGRPQWWPDGQTLSFSANGKLFSVRIDTRDVSTVADDGRFSRASPIVSPDGQWVAVHASSVDAEPGARPLGAVHILRVDGTEETVVSGDVAAWGGNFGPSWSADSRGLAWVVPRTIVDPEFGEYNVPDGIAIARREGTEWVTSSVEGVEGLGDQAMLDWAPRGGRLAYMREGVAENVVPNHLMVVEDDGTLRQLTPEPLSQGFCWSPDATRIAAIDSDAGLVILNVETGARVAELGLSPLNVGDACVWSAWAGEPQ